MICSLCLEIFLRINLKQFRSVAVVLGLLQNQKLRFWVIRLAKFRSRNGTKKVKDPKPNKLYTSIKKKSHKRYTSIYWWNYRNLPQSHWCGKGFFFSSFQNQNSIWARKIAIKQNRFSIFIQQLSEILIEFKTLKKSNHHRFRQTQTKPFVNYKTQLER